MSTAWPPAPRHETVAQTTVPNLPRSSARLETRTSAPVLTPASAGNRSAVVASGDEALRTAVAAELKAMRWSVQLAAGAAEMMVLLDRQQAAVVLVDSWLPDLDVRECVAELRYSCPELDVMTLDGTDIGALPARSTLRNEVLHAVRQAGERMDSASAVPSPATAITDTAAWCGSLPESEILRRHAEGARMFTRQEPSAPAFSASGETNTGSVSAVTAAISNAWDQRTATPEIHMATPLAIPLPEFVGTDPRLLEVSRRIRLVAHRKTAVLVHGPTGTGKELVARAVHRLSGRSGRFIAINCAAIPEALVEAELFGHARGAFTGAQGSRVGKIEAAAGGTLFLDEIGELPFAVQSKLLRFLESGEVQRVGENEPIHVDVRVVAATHRKLGAMTVEGTFRLDLLHRLSVFLVHTPALVGRRNDINALIAHTLQQLAVDESAKQLSAAAREKLMAYNWPGNVRELAHTLERAWILSGESALIDECCVDFGESLF